MAYMKLEQTPSTEEKTTSSPNVDATAPSQETAAESAAPGQPAPVRTSTTPISPEGPAPVPAPVETEFASTSSVDSAVSPPVTSPVKRPQADERTVPLFAIFIIFVVFTLLAGAAYYAYTKSQ